jgi:hypothetical protein
LRGQSLLKARGRKKGQFAANSAFFSDEGAFVRASHPSLVLSQLRFASGFGCEAAY